MKAPKLKAKPVTLSPSAKVERVFEGVRWDRNRPSNGQARDWTSFELIVVEDEGRLYWGASCLKDEYYLTDRVNYYPVPDGIDKSNLSRLVWMESSAQWKSVCS